MGDNGKITDIFAAAHATENPEGYKFPNGHKDPLHSYHDVPEFLPYHRGLLYHYESVVRALPDEGDISFKNFALPYFDHTVENAWDIVKDSVSYLGGFAIPNVPNDNNCKFQKVSSPNCLSDGSEFDETKYKPAGT